MTRQEELAANLAAVERRIQAACRAAGRARAELTLIAVSKSWPAADVLRLCDLGVHDFGENRDREAADKVAAVATGGAAKGRAATPAGAELPLPRRDVPTSVRWHFVGSVQTNKARSVAGYADVVHSLDRPSLVRAMAAGARGAGRTVQALVQVSLDGAPDRGGVTVDQVLALADLVAGTEGLALAGVMAVAPRGVPAAPAFERLVAVAEEVRSSHPAARVISAGMSGDLEAAVQAGANALRVGTALFGHRVPPLR